MKIEYHISQLLYRYQCITIPGFGSFLTETRSARIFEDADAFYPPEKIIFFSTHLKNNDGLLASHVSRIEKITYEEALASIYEEVTHWKEVLQNEKTLNIKNIGVLLLNSENNLVFEAFQQTNYLTSSFGLSSFAYHSIRKKVYEQQTKDSKKKTPAIFTSKNKNSHYLKYAAIFIIALGISSTGLELRNNYIENQTLVVKTAVQKEVENKIQEATFFINSPIPSVTFKVKEEKFSYHVVAGAFREKYNAEKEYKNLIQLGYKARKTEKNKHGLYTVFCGSFAAYTEAQKLLNEIQKTYNPEAWILIDGL